jgi:hypothetical protein
MAIARIIETNSVTIKLLQDLMYLLALSCRQANRHAEGAGVHGRVPENR